MTLNLFFILFIIVAIIIIVVVCRKHNKRRAEEIYDEHVEHLTSMYGNISQCIPYISVPDSVFVFDESQYIVLGYITCRFELIQDVRLDVISKSRSRDLRDILIGGLLFGWLGAIVAANCSNDDDDSDEYVVTLIIDNPPDPVIRYRTEDYFIANRLYGMVRTIIERNQRKCHQST